MRALIHDLRRAGRGALVGAQDRDDIEGLDLRLALEGGFVVALRASLAGLKTPAEGDPGESGPPSGTLHVGDGYWLKSSN